MKCFNVKEEWVAFVSIQPEEERLYLYEAMFNYLKTCKKIDSPSMSLTYLYMLMSVSVRNIRNGSKGGKPKRNPNVTQSKPKRNPDVVNTEVVTEKTEQKKEKEISSSPRTLSSKDKERKYIKESRKEISAEEKAFADRFTKDYPRCMTMQEPLTYQQFCSVRDRFVSEGKTQGEANILICSAMEQLNNNPQLKKQYISCYKVLLNWQRRGFMENKKL